MTKATQKAAVAPPAIPALGRQAEAHTPPSVRLGPLPSVTTVLSATTVGAPTQIATVSGGYLSSVGPVSMRGVAIPRGRIYAEAWLQDAMGNRISRLWGGYLHCGADANGKNVPAGPVSLPGIPIDPSWTVIVVATQTSQGSAIDIGFKCIVTDQPVGQGTVMNEPPYSGAGESRSITLGDPAAGAEYPVQTVPACAVWRPRGFRGTLVCDATVTSRALRLLFDDGANTHSGSITNRVASATENSAHLGHEGASAAGASGYGTTINVPDIKLVAGWRVNFSTTNLQAGDNWGPGYLMIEEWAVPS